MVPSLGGETGGGGGEQGENSHTKTTGLLQGVKRNRFSNLLGSSSSKTEHFRVPKRKSKKKKQMTGGNVLFEN